MSPLPTCPSRCMSLRLFGQKEPRHSYTGDTAASLNFRYYLYMYMNKSPLGHHTSHWIKFLFLNSVYYCCCSVAYLLSFQLKLERRILLTDVYHSYQVQHSNIITKRSCNTVSLLSRVHMLLFIIIIESD